MFKRLFITTLTLLLAACVTPTKPKPSAAFDRASTADKNRLEFTDAEIARLAECTAGAKGDAEFKTKCAKMFQSEKLLVLVDRADVSPDALTITANDGLGVIFTCRVERTAPRPSAGARVQLSGFVSHFEENKARKAGVFGPKETTTYEVEFNPCVVN